MAKLGQHLNPTTDIIISWRKTKYIHWGRVEGNICNTTDLFLLLFLSFSLPLSLSHSLPVSVSVSPSLSLYIEKINLDR